MTDDEQEFIQAIRGAVDYWRREKRVTSHEALSGLAHSILCVLDGVSSTTECCYDLIRKQSDDEDEDGNPVETGDRIVSTMFHELLYKDGWR